MFPEVARHPGRKLVARLIELVESVEPVQMCGPHEEAQVVVPLDPGPVEVYPELSGPSEEALCGDVYVPPAEVECHEAGTYGEAVLFREGDRRNRNPRRHLMEYETQMDSARPLRLGIDADLGEYLKIAQALDVAMYRREVQWLAHAHAEFSRDHVGSGHFVALQLDLADRPALVGSEGGVGDDQIGGWLHIHVGPTHRREQSDDEQAGPSPDHRIHFKVVMSRRSTQGAEPLRRGPTADLTCLASFCQRKATCRRR